MAERIVDPFEFVEINAKQGQLALVRSGIVQRARHSAAKMLAVRQTRQLIVICKPPNLVGGCPTFRNVAGEDNEMRRLT